MSGHGYRTERSPVEGIFHGNKLIAPGLFRIGISSRSFQRAFVCLAAAVCKKHPVHAGNPVQFPRRLSAALVIVEVGSMVQPVDLRFQRIVQFPAVIPQADNRKPCCKIKIFPALCVIEIHSLAVVKSDGKSVIDVDQIFLCRLNVTVHHCNTCFLYCSILLFRFLCS